MRVPRPGPGIGGLGWLAGLVLLGASSPTPAREATQSPTLKLPADAIFERTVGADSAVVFRHGPHVALAANRCTACHPRYFRILVPTRALRHREMNAGRACGACHDGRQAFGVRDPGACASCHVGRSAMAGRAAAPGGEGAPAAPRGPKPLVFPQGEASPGPVTFRHDTHSGGKAGCVACHPRPFAVKRSASPPGTAMHEAEGCGRCHDGTGAFDLAAEDACARCHAQEEAAR